MIASLLLALVAGCAGAPQKQGDFRNGGPIYSNAVLDLGRLDGQWQQVATFAAPDSRPCRKGGTARIRSVAPGLTISARLCLDGRDVTLSGPVTVTGPGRLTPARAPAPLDREWWVLWADADLRTLVIGTPDGSFGTILNRGGPLPSDRLTAARDILAWNGYDTAQLRLLPGGGS